MIAGTFTFYNEIELFVMQMEVLLSLCDIVIIQGDNPPDELIELAKSYERTGKVYFMLNQKDNNFFKRDELGDRERLLIKARELGADCVFHTETDEILRLQDIPKVKELIKNYNYDHIIQFKKYDLWYNAHNYRLSYHININAGKEIPMIDPPQRIECIFPIKDATYGSKEIPNFHCERVPYHYKNGKPKTKFYDDIHVIHFGYFRKSQAEKKKEFYQTDKSIPGDIFGYDMLIDDKQFIKEFGMGILERK